MTPMLVRTIAPAMIPELKYNGFTFSSAVIVFTFSGAVVVFTFSSAVDVLLSVFVILLELSNSKYNLKA